METFDLYASVLAVVGIALLLVATGIEKKQLVWKAKPVALRRRRRR